MKLSVPSISKEVLGLMRPLETTQELLEFIWQAFKNVFHIIRNILLPNKIQRPLLWVNRELLYVTWQASKNIFHFIRDWLPKFANGLNIIIDIVQNVYEWSSCPFAKMIPQWENHFGKITTWSLKCFLNYAYYGI